MAGITHPTILLPGAVLSEYLKRWDRLKEADSLAIMVIKAIF